MTLADHGSALGAHEVRPAGWLAAFAGLPCWLGFAGDRLSRRGVGKPGTAPADAEIAGP